MDETQRKDAFQLLVTSLSAKGYEKAHVIINLEPILGRIEQVEGGGRLPVIRRSTSYDMTGNVWEWYSSDYSKSPDKNPPGPGPAKTGCCAAAIGAAGLSVCAWQ